MTQLVHKSEEARSRIDELTRLIEHHRFLYYVLDKPEIDDSEFDVLFNELLALEKEYPELASPSSPTRKVGAPPSTDFAEVRHRVPMLSLANAMGEEDLLRWQERLGRGLIETTSLLSSLQYVCELKIDGLSISLTYKNGELFQGATRGNGVLGEDVTLNLRTIASLPHRLLPLFIDENGEPCQPDRSGAREIVPELVEARGEVFMPVSSFQSLNAGLEESGEQLFANPRNAASGSLRQKNPRITAQRKLALWLYMLHIEDSRVKLPESHMESLALLAQLGLPVEPNRSLVAGIENVIAYCSSWSDKRHGLDYQTDGVVIKLDDKSLWNELGATSHSPRWAIAFKYPPEEALTEVLSVEFEVGRTGAVTPVAVLAPVKLAGTTVKRASLHNQDQILRLDLHYGDTVVVRKAGEIIPEIVSVKLERRKPGALPVVYPRHCPICQSELLRISDEVALRCPNTYGCRSQIERRIKHFVSREAMNIEGMGEILVKALVERNLLERASDIYRLDSETLASLPRMGNKSASNIVSAVETSKSRPFASLLYALGIRHVGVMVSELIAGRFPDIERLRAASVEDISAIEGVGPVIGQALVDFLACEENKRLLTELESCGVNLGHLDQVQNLDAPSTLPGNFAGLTVVVTGTLSGMDRLTAEKSIRERGGKSSSSVSKKTSFLVAGENAGSKLKKARELGVPVVDEAEFTAMLSSDKPPRFDDVNK